MMRKALEPNQAISKPSSPEIEVRFEGMNSWIFTSWIKGD
jgi:hypothetical protein